MSDHLSPEILDFPTDYEILHDLSLYKPFNIPNRCYKAYSFLNKNQNIDIYCPYCKKNSTIKGGGIPTNLLETEYNHETHRTYLNSSKEHLAIKELTCSRDLEHSFNFIFQIKNNQITKIGQHPSMADINIGEIKQYSKSLKKSNAKDLSTSIGLASHGVGIGSFVYLRRVFENLVAEAIELAKKDKHWSVPENFDGKRVTEKIKLLKGFLPDFVIDTKEIYGLLSKGIHELPEHTCLENHPILLEAICLILDDKEALRLKNERKSKLKKKIADLHSSQSSTHTESPPPQTQS